MQIWLVRHASTSAQEEGRLQGQLDFPLSARGKEEAAKLAARLKNEVEFSRIFSSNLKRARDTAVLIAREGKKELEINYLPLLREYGWGVFEGLTWEEVAFIYPEQYRKIKRNYWRTYIPGRESRRGFISRVRALGRRVEYFPRAEKAILLVTHARLINAFITHMIGGDLNQKWLYSPQPASISVLERKPATKDFDLINFNDCHHLNS
ncbi:MAG: histidine phosphatase family protein [Firmicutes bacterium]|jgi:broad specificity phosphatase PhoE|nr:histidine phosphatase family protein [Bacillota bacterium]